MERVEKTAFLSYRRSNIPWALAIFQDLTHHGYDVFFDYSGIASGDFESVILENIRARAHFLVLLTPSALERCNNPADLLRREIETALASQRNIVPLMLEGFDFGTPKIASQLTGKLAALKNYNGMSIPPEYFTEAMGRLRNKFLNVPQTAVLHPVSAFVKRASSEQKAAADAAPAVKEEELTAQQWFERGLAAADVDERLRFYCEAIRLDPDFAEAYYNRGNAHSAKFYVEGALLYNEAIRLKPDYAGAKGDLEDALQDYNEAIRLIPDYVEAYNNRGVVRHAKGDVEGALQDYNEAIRLEPDHADAYINRGNERRVKGDIEGALQDYNKAIRLKPDLGMAYYNRGIARHDKGDVEGELRDFNEAIRLMPDYALAYYNRGNARRAKGDVEGELQDFNEAIRLMPDFSGAYHNRGRARHDKGDVEGALQDYNEAIRLKPDFALYYYNRSEARRAKGDVAGAQQDYIEAIRLGYPVR